MKLKRYVLLDNNRIVDRTKLDTTNSYGYLMLNIIKAIENKEENVCRQLVATSDEATDLIRVGDLFELSTMTSKVVFQALYIDEKNKNIYADSFWFSINNIKTIYKLIGKDYICVWEKEISK